MTLEANVHGWEDRSARVRRWLVRSIVFAVLGYFGTIFSMIGYSPGRAALEGTPWAALYGAIIGTFAIGAFVALLASIGLAIAYFVKYAPALRRARFDAQTSLILQLQEQIAELRADLQQRDKL